MEINPAPTVVVKKSGFFAALAGGFFGTVITIVLCGTALGIYGLRVVDGKLDSVLDFGSSFASQIEDWREVLPPLVSDAFNDRPGGDYDQNISIEARLVESGRHSDRVVFAVTNNGQQAVSWLAINVVLKDDDDLPLDDFRVYAATPLPLPDDDWRGPLRSGSTREFAVWKHHGRGDTDNVVVEISEIRLQNDPGASTVAQK